MQEIQKYEKILVEAFSVESPETRWSMFAEIVEQIYREIQQEGRSYFYERCLSCYHSGITPSGQKLNPGWFSRNALNIVFAVHYLLNEHPPQFLKTIMMNNFGSLNNILRESPATQSSRYAILFREAQNFYDARLCRVLASEADAAAEKQGCSANSIPPIKHNETRSSSDDNCTKPLETAFAAQFSAAAEQKPAEEASASSTEADAEAEETADAFAEAEDTPSLPDMILPILEENRSALQAAMHAQKQVDAEIKQALSSLGDPFSPGAASYRQTLSALDALVLHQEECNRILLSKLSAIENALGAAQWNGFVEVAALLDEFGERHQNPERRRAGAMWGDIRAIRQRYLNQLYRQGIEPIVPAAGEAFDEDLHELSPDADIDIDDAARITNLHSRGYRMGDIVFLRAVVDADDETPDAE